MSGALAERDFVAKLTRYSFTDIEIVERVPFTTEDCAGYPLFTPDLIELMNRLLGPRATVATSVVVRARLAETAAPDAPAAESAGSPVLS